MYIAQKMEKNPIVFSIQPEFGKLPVPYGHCWQLEQDCVTLGPVDTLANLLHLFWMLMFALQIFQLNVASALFLAFVFVLLKQNFHVLPYHYPHLSFLPHPLPVLVLYTHLHDSVDTFYLHF